jgi:hypothetical protein
MLLGINPLRVVSRFADMVVPFLVPLLDLPFFHHVVVLDDCSYIDSFGVPRVQDGSVVRVLDLSATMSETYHEIELGMAWSYMVTDMATYVAMPLAEYGDACESSFFRVDYGPRSEKDRDAILNRCESVMRSWFGERLRYSFVHGNCEHYTTWIVQEVFSSPELVAGCWSLLRLGVQLLAAAVVLLARKPSGFPSSAWIMSV